MRAKVPALRQFSRDAVLLIAVSGMFAISFYGIHALLSVLYILRLGHGPKYVGWFSASAALSYMTMSLPSGALGGRFGTHKIMLAGGILTVMGLAALPLVEFVPSAMWNAWPIAAQMLRTMGWSMLNVNLVPALMAATTAQNRESAYALNSALKGLGTFMGTVFGGLLPTLFANALGQTLAAPGPYRFSLWTGAAIGLLALMPLALIRQAGRAASGERAQAGEPFPLLPVVMIIVHVYLSQGGWATCQAFCSAYMDTDLHLSPLSIGLITSIGQFVAILAPFLTPRLAAHRSNGWTMMVTTLGMAISLAPLALLPHWTAAGLGRLGIAVLASIWMPALQVFQMEWVDSQWRSLAYGAVSTALALSYSSVSIAGGYIISARGYSSLFLLGAGLSVAGAVVMWYILKNSVVQAT